MFFELGAATSLIVLAALQPVPSATKSEPARAANTPLVVETAAERPVMPGKARGRKRSAPLGKVMDRLTEAGGKLEGSLDDIGARLGLPSKSSAHRALNALAGAGLITLATSTAGTLVQIR